ncbi:MAG: AAA family ATPase [Granulosicoccus sp.]
MITVVASLKGGSGKSTLVFNLAIWLAKSGRRVSTCDLDPQATLSDVVEVRNEENFQPTIEVLNISDDVATDLEHCRDLFDEVLVDVGTADFSALKKAIGIADQIIIPVPPSQADIWSTQRFLKIVNESVNLSIRTTSPRLACFINRADTHHAVRESDEAEAALETLAGIELLRTRLGQRTVFRRSLSEGVAVFELEPTSKGTLEFFALATALYNPLTISTSKNIT